LPRRRVPFALIPQQQETNSRCTPAAGHSPVQGFTSDKLATINRRRSKSDVWGKWPVWFTALCCDIALSNMYKSPQLRWEAGSLANEDERVSPLCNEAGSCGPYSYYSVQKTFTIMFIFITIIIIIVIIFFGPPLWSSGQSFWLQIRRSGFDSRRYQIFWEVVGLERDPLSPVNTTE
jgi:hypothetical protein